MLTHEGVVAFRDPAGLRPLALGRLGDRWCVASESCAFDIIGATYERDVNPGEVVRLSEEGLTSRQVVEGHRRAFCVFEHIYFARPDSLLEGNRTQVSRRKMGEILWREAPVEADVVIAVPDSGNPAAAGYAQASGLPKDDGLIKNRYVARTFIQPGQELRKHGLRMKFNPLPEVVAGKRIVVVDDSIVRGNTTRQIVQMLRDAGAARGAHADLGPADPQPLPLRRRHVHARGDDRPRADGRGDRRGARLRLAGLPVPRRRLRGDPRHRARRTATPASPASTRCRAPRRRPASSRSSRCPSSRSRRLNPARCARLRSAGVASVHAVAQAAGPGDTLDFVTDPRAELQRLFGFDDFRPGQREAVEAALAARDSLVVMPTGAGKSLCYQLPALMADGDGLTVVVSPLVSLMQDQVDGLRAHRRRPGRARQRPARRGGQPRTLRRAVDGELSLLYVAPERFASPGFARELKEASIRLFVVDEAHCVSQWGHDFRPDYFRLADAARWLGVGAIMAATATATPEVARDIVRRLGLQDPVRVATGFDRPNLSLARRPGPGRPRAAASRASSPRRARCRRSSTRARARRPTSCPSG